MAGETIQFNGSIRNETEKPLQNLTAELLYHVRLTAGRRSTIHTSRVIKTMPLSVVIPSGGFQYFAGVLAIPLSLKAPTISNGHLVDVSYSLKLILRETPYDVKYVCIPVVIGTNRTPILVPAQSSEPLN
jgi:hypothetical protein